MKFLTLLCQRWSIFSSILIFSSSIYSNPIKKELTTGEWIKVVYDVKATEYLGSLEKDQQLEQARDWMVLAALNYLELDSAELMAYYFDLFPVRADYLSRMANYSKGISRTVMLKENILLLFLPHKDPNQQNQKELLKVADEYRMLLGKTPDTVLLFSYRNRNDHGIDFSFKESIKGQTLYSDQYGYYEEVVYDNQSLERFLKQTDDLVYVEKLNSKLLLGGRKHHRNSKLTIDIEDLSCLYNSISKNGRPVFSLDPKLDRDGLRGELERLINDSPKYFRQLVKQEKYLGIDPFDLHTSLHDKSELIKPIIEDLKNNSPRGYYKVRQYLNGHYADTGFVHKEIIKDIGKGLNLWEQKYMDQKSCNCSKEPMSMEKRLLRFQKQVGIDTTGRPDSSTWSYLRKYNDDNQHLPRLDTFLEILYNQYVSINPRYEGGIKGTRVAMTMFYTDLAMKLWDSRYQGSELKVNGFARVLDRKNMDEVFWDEITSYPITRSWLAIDEGGFDLHNNDNILNFKHICTRKNARSRSTFFSQENERSPTPHQVQLTKWWNDNFERIADYEPEFYRLNQIMKWSVVLEWLSKSKINYLSHLNSVYYKKNYVFGNWYKRNLALKAKVDINFTSSLEGMSKNFSLYDTLLNQKIFGGVVSGFDKKRIGYTEERLLVHKNQKPKEVMDLGKSKLDENGFGSLLDIYGNVKRITQKNQPTISKAQKEEYFISKNGKITPQPISQIIEKNQDQAIVRPLNKFLLPEVKVSNSSKENSSEANTQIISIVQRNSELRFIKEIANDAIESANSSFVHQNGSKYVSNTIIKENKKLDILISELKDTDEVLITHQVINSNDLVDLGKAKIIDFQTGREISNTSTGKGNNSDVQLYINSLGNNELLFSLFKDRSTYKVRLDETYGKTVTRFPTPEESIDNKHKTKIPKREKVYFNSATEQLFLGKRSKNLIEVNIPKKNIFNSLHLESIQNVVFRAAQELNFFNRKTNIVVRGRSKNWISIINRKKEKNLQNNFAEELLSQCSYIRGIIFSKNIKGLSLNPKNYLQIPWNYNQYKQLAVRFLDAINTSPSKIKYYKEFSEINLSHLRFMENIDVSNSKLIDTYINHFHKLDDLPEDMAIADIRFDEKKPQFIYKSFASRDVRVVDVDYYGPKDISGAFAATQSFKEAKEITKPYFEFLTSVAEKSNSKTIVLLEPEGIDANLVWAIHDGNPTIKFRRDQNNVQRSINYYNTKIFPAPSKTVVFSPGKLKGEIYGDIAYQGCDTLSNSNWWDFQSIMKNPRNQQIIFLDTFSNKGIISFEDDSINTYTLLSFINSLDHVKQLAFIVSPNAKSLKKIFGNSGKFKRVITLEFKRNADTPIRSFLDFLRRAYSTPYRSGTPGNSSRNRSNINTTIDNILDDIGNEQLHEMNGNGIRRGGIWCPRCIPQMKAFNTSKNKYNDIA